MHRVTDHFQDIAETSDPGEREIIDATNSSYWETAASIVRLRAQSLSMSPLSDLPHTTSPAADISPQSYIPHRSCQPVPQTGTAYTYVPPGRRVTTPDLFSIETQHSLGYRGTQLSSSSSSHHVIDAVLPSSPTAANSPGCPHFLSSPTPSSGPLPLVDQFKFSDASRSESSGTSTPGCLYQGTVIHTLDQSHQEGSFSSSTQSPLTAISSDRGSPRASNVQHESPTLEMSANPVRVDLSPDTADDPGSRYSFRARKAQQLNPYAFDKILYHRQMESNPDAIVQSVGHSITRSLSDGEFTGDHSLAIDQICTPTPASESDEPNTTNTLKLRKGKRMIPKPYLTTRTASVASAGDACPTATTRWYPDVFQSHSSDDDSSAAFLATRRSIRKRSISETVPLKYGDQEQVAAFSSNASDNGTLEVYNESQSHSSESYQAESSGSDSQERHAPALSHKRIHDQSTLRAAQTSRPSVHLALNSAPQTSRRRPPARVKHKDSVRPPWPRDMQIRDFKSGGDVGRTLRSSSSKQGGLSVLRSANGYVTGRLHKRQATTIDMEDEALQKALVPVPVSSLSRGFRDTSTFLSSLTSSSDDDRSAACIPKQKHLANHIVVDLEVKAVPRGFDFTPDSYLRKGWLRELLLTISGSGKHIAWHEDEYYGHRLPSSPSIDDISIYLRATTAAIREVFTSLPVRRGDVSRACAAMHFICQMISSFSAQITDKEHTELAKLVINCTDTLLATLDTRQDLSTTSSITLDSRVIHVYWFSLEIVVRLNGTRPPALIEELSKCIKLRSLSLVRRLLQFGMKSIVQATHQNAPVDCYSTQGSAMQAWICILHLCNARSPLGWRLPFNTVWELVQTTLTSRKISSRPLTDSEDVWLVAFGISMLSHLSVHGHLTTTSCVPTSWDTIVLALNRVRLASHADLDWMLDRSTIVKRDGYIRVVIQRCLLLHQRWHWTFDGIMAILSLIADIFKSRKFSNLTGESSDFPAFMKHSDRDLLFELVAEDNTFVLFLKLFAKSMECIEPKTEPEYSNKVRRHLLTIVPVGSIHFDVQSADSDLSVLYNRFGIIAAAIYIRPSPPSAQHYVALARYYIRFSEASTPARSICISGLMYLGLQMQRLGFPLDDIFGWATQIANCLVHEYRHTTPEQQLANEASVETPTTQCFRLLLQSLCHLVTSEPLQNGLHKLHIGFLEGIWISTALATPDFSYTAGVASSVRDIIHAYLQNCMQNQVAIEIRQESQDEYGQFELDMDDPELSVALGDSSQVQSLDDSQQHVDTILNVIKTNIMPSLYQLICHHSCHAKEEPADNMIHLSLYAWVDCWIECVNFLVQHKKEEWSNFILLGQYSWGRIIDNCWRYYVGLQFMFSLLKHEPSLYKMYQHLFFQIWVQCLVAWRVTAEHQYLLLLIEVDNSQHFILQQLPQGFQQTLKHHKFQDLQIEILSGELPHQMRYVLIYFQLFSVFCHTLCQIIQLILQSQLNIRMS
ncbi:hypothetical protein DENSPDRAFT_834143 [Dentipellis sp. KUC8613]|nr:hypothetical protein DENSPDRAFT_834143 [Dentipellis sp. KUC8613]